MQRRESFLVLIVRRLVCKAVLLCFVMVVRSAPSGFSIALSFCGARHMSAEMVDAWRMMPMCFNQWMGVSVGLKKAWLNGCMYLAATRVVVVVRSCGDVRIESGGK